MKHWLRAVLGVLPKTRWPGRPPQAQAAAIVRTKSHQSAERLLLCTLEPPIASHRHKSLGMQLSKQMPSKAVMPAPQTTMTGQMACPLSASAGSNTPARPGLCCPEKRPPPCMLSASTNRQHLSPSFHSPRQHEAAHARLPFMPLTHWSAVVLI